MKCDACGSEGDLRLVGELLGPGIQQACRNCVGPGIGWFYMRRPGDFDDDAPIATDESQLALTAKS